MLCVNFTSQDYLRDPVAGVTKLRAAGPVVQVSFPIVGKTWITTTSDLAGRVLKDSGTFTMRQNGRLAGRAGGCQGGYARSQSAC
jgi:cytochrome P450 PksS